MIVAPPEGGVALGRGWVAGGAGSARLVLVGGAVPLHPHLQAFEAMLEGVRAQQAAR